MEVYRHLADDFLIQFCRGLERKDFVIKQETVSRKRKGQREYLNDYLTNLLVRDFYAYLENKVRVPRIEHGSSQTLETLIQEEAPLLAKYLRRKGKLGFPGSSAPSPNA